MDRITKIHVRNIRAIESLDLEISPLTALIGENGSGKSTILECFEILRKATEPDFLQQLSEIHRGMPSLLRKGASFSSLGLTIEDESDSRRRVTYRFELRPNGTGAVVSGEYLMFGPNRFYTLHRDASGGQIFDQNSRERVPLPAGAFGLDRLAIGHADQLPPQQTIERLLAVLRGIEVHTGFDTIADWAGQTAQRRSVLRGAQLLRPASRLDLLGNNLASAWSALKNIDEAHWRATMALVRAGLGEGIDTINTIPDPSGGQVSVALKRRDLPEAIPASSLSDGQLAWLSLVAIVRLSSGRTLLAIDEPERHLQPSLLGTLVSALADLGGQPPVLLATRSDRVLEQLGDPVSAARFCGLDGSRATVSGLDPRELARWLERFGDIRQLGASDQLKRVLAPTTVLEPDVHEWGQ